MKVTALSLAFLAASTMSAANAGEPARLLARMKSACGGSSWDRVQSWHERSVAEIEGMPLIQNEVWHDMRTLKSAMTSSINGKAIRRTGFNGKTAWRVGPDGQAKMVSDEAELRRERRDVYLSSFGWFFAKRFPARISNPKRESFGGRRYLVINVEPKDAEPFDLWVDPSTLLVRRIVAGTEFAELSDYKMFDGVCTATNGRQGDNASGRTIMLKVLDVKTGEVAPAAVFETPQ